MAKSRATRISNAKRGQVSKQNLGTYDTEKRAKELFRRGFNEAAVSGMMEIPEKDARKFRDHKTKDIHCDGEL